MGQARHPLSLWLATAAAALALLGSGCGSSDQSSSSSGATQGTSKSGGAAASTTPPGARVAICGSTIATAGQVRVAGADCDLARGIVASWDKRAACGAPANVSRASCSVGKYRCLGTVTERGLAVTCARPGSSISFVAKGS